LIGRFSGGRGDTLGPELTFGSCGTTANGGSQVGSTGSAMTKVVVVQRGDQVAGTTVSVRNYTKRICFTATKLLDV